MITAVATVFSVITQAKEKPVYATILVAVALLAAASVFYSPAASFGRNRIQRSGRNRAAHQLWPEFQLLEKQFVTFLNKEDQTNLRYILSDICNRNPDDLIKFCPPDYLNEFCPLLIRRHGEMNHRHESDLRLAMSEFRIMVASYNDNYVLGPLKRIKNGQLLALVQPHNKQHYEERVEDFRERWAGFLDKFKEFLEKANNNLDYEPYHEAISTYFERPKKVSLG